MKITRIKTRCNTCLLCVRECVSGAWRNVDGAPVMVAPHLCNRCGHCVAVCPQSAIYHEGLDYRQVRETKPSILNPEAYEEVVRTRRSIRQFKDKDVPASEITDILDLARHSPTASNKQNVGYIVITDRTLIQEMAHVVFNFTQGLYKQTQKGIGKKIYGVIKKIKPDGISRYMEPMEYYIKESEKGRDFILHNAPVLVLILGPKKERFASDNCNIASTNIMNYSHSKGLGTCYIGFLVLAFKLFPSLKKKVHLPKNRKVYAALALGYPAYKHSYTGSRKQLDVTWMS